MGGGIDFNLSGGMAFKVDVSDLAINGTRMFRPRGTDVGGGWGSNINISTGLVFNIGN